MIDKLLKVCLVAIVCITLYANWDKITGKDANASASQTLANSEPGGKSYMPLLTLDDANCWIMDSIIESSGTLSNQTSDFYKGILVEIAIQNENGDSIRTMRVKTQPSQIAGYSTIDFQAMVSFGKLKPARCRLDNVLVLEEHETEYVAIDWE